MDSELQVFAIRLTKRIVSEVEGIVESYKRNPEEGLSSYHDFLRRMKPSLEKLILEGLRNPEEIGHISSRLLRDPLSEEFLEHRRSLEEEESHIVGYLKAIIQFVYCLAKGLETWQFPNTPLYKESLKTTNVGKIEIIPSLVQIVRQEIGDIFNGKLGIDMKEKKTKKKDNLTDVNMVNGTLAWKEQKVDYLYQPINEENTDVPFTARLMAYYRAQECKNDSPLFIDPFAERLAGDLTSYAKTHKFIVEKGDYPLVRSFYIEKNLLTTWCDKKKLSQIVLLGAGFDTRAYRFKPLQTNKHTIFEIDLPVINGYKQMIMKNETPICDLVCISADISNLEWISHLTNYSFFPEIPTFWVLEGLVYYIEQERVITLLKKIAEISTDDSQIFIDVCVPALSELMFGPFTRHFKWGLEKKNVSAFFANTGWDVSCSWADDHDQGRDIGQRGLIFIHGTKL